MTAQVSLFGAEAGAKAPVVVVGLPIDLTSSSHRGCRDAPHLLRLLSANAGLRATTALHDLSTGERLLSSEDLSDIGDLELRPALSVSDWLSFATEITRAVFAEERKLFALGGDHLAALPAIQGLALARKAPFQVIQLDAHTDHMSPAEGEQPTHENFMAWVCREANVSQIALVGMRGFGGPADELPKKIRKTPLSDLPNTLLCNVPVYLTVDSDFFDPTVLPAVGHPEPEGYFLRDLDQVLQAIREKNCPLLGGDWVEYNPSLDSKNHLSGQFVLRGIAKILSAMST